MQAMLTVILYLVTVAIVKKSSGVFKAVLAEINKKILVVQDKS